MPSRITVGCTVLGAPHNKTKGDKMRHILSIICCLVIIISAVFVGVVKPETIIKGYSSVVEIIGKSQLTSDFSLIGERYDKTDDYTGSYKGETEEKSGLDVVFGGCSVHGTDLKISGHIDKESGKVKIFTRNGKTIDQIEVNENGTFSQEINFDGGDSYILVQYDKFTGTIDFTTEYL